MVCALYFARLGSHLSPSGTECYITSDMFYVEVQLDGAGQLVDVKVAHQGENPTVRLTPTPKKFLKMLSDQNERFCFSTELP